MEAWQGKAEALKRLNRYEEFNTALEKAIELRMAPTVIGIGVAEDIDLEMVRTENAEFCLDQETQQPMVRSHEKAIDSYDQALRHKSDGSEVLYGLVLSSLGRYEEAIASFDQVLYQQPDHPEAWHVRGSVLNELGRYEEAVVSLDQALHYKPDHPEAWYIRGNVLSRLGRYEEAIVSFDQALHHEPDHSKAWYIRGNVLNELKRYEEAVASFDQALYHKPNHPKPGTTRVNASKTWMRMGMRLRSIDAENLQHKSVI